MSRQRTLLFTWVVILSIVMATACAPAAPATENPSASGGSETASGKWCSGVTLRFFAGGDEGDSFASIVLRGAKAAEADLGQVLAALLANRTKGAKALLAGYAQPIDREALRWYTAASVLARIALPAVSRYRPAQLAHLRELLEAGTNLITPVAA